MPILTSGTSGAAGLGRRYRIEGLPDFNGLDWNFIVEEFDGFDSAPGVRSELVANGGGPGAVPVGPWDAVEEFLTLRASIEAPSPGDVEPLRDALLMGLPTTREVPLVMLGGTWGTDKQMFVRRYDRVEALQLEHYFYATVPVVAADPYKYGVETLIASVGAFEILDAFRVYLDDVDGGYRVYEPDGSIAYRTYETDEEESGSSEPRVAVLESPGMVTSRRVTTTVTGPLVAGDWFIDDDQGNRTWVEVTLAPGESVVLDTRNFVATLRGTDISHLMFGPFPKLRPGGNSWRLITNGASGSGHMTIEALWATE